jgi:hypothetical protein
MDVEADLLRCGNERVGGLVLQGDVVDLKQRLGRIDRREGLISIHSYLLKVLL